MVEIGGNHFLFRVAEDAFQLAFRRRLHLGLDGRVGGLGVGARRLLEAARQVHDGNVERRNAERHARQFALEGRNDFAHGLGSAGRRRNDVARCGAAAERWDCSQARSMDGRNRGQLPGVCRA